VGKKPVTDLGKASLMGYHDLVCREGVWQTVPGEQPDSQLKTVFEDGEILALDTIRQIRQRAWGE
jgi:hypothetical protein